MVCTAADRDRLCGSGVMLQQADLQQRRRKCERVQAVRRLRVRPFQDVLLEPFAAFLATAAAAAAAAAVVAAASSPAAISSAAAAAVVVTGSAHDEAGDWVARQQQLSQLPQPLEQRLFDAPENEICCSSDHGECCAETNLHNLGPTAIASRIYPGGSRLQG